MVKITFIFGSYMFLRIARHDIFSPSDHFPASRNLYIPRDLAESKSRCTSSRQLTGRPPSVSGGRCWLKSEQWSFVIHRTVRNIPKFKDRASWSRDTFQPMRRRACVYQQTNQNIAPMIKNFQNNGRSRRTELQYRTLPYSSRFHI